MTLCASALFFFSFSFAHAATVEEEVRDYFKDTPVMIAIAQCESKFKQFGGDGSALYGGWGGGMIGVYQIFERVHDTAATSLGFDISTLEGNLGYAKHLYTLQGTTPWNSSKSCWQNAVLKTETTEKTEKTVKSEKKNTKVLKERELKKKIAELSKLVAQLQKLLAEKRGT
jgi:hypothetical protein